jgi:hypothetical protein
MSNIKSWQQKKDLKLGFTLVIGVMGAGFSYIINILNTIITALY